MTPADAKLFKEAARTLSKVHNAAILQKRQGIFPMLQDLWQEFNSMAARDFSSDELQQIAKKIKNIQKLVQ